jgi:hypothetical protein
MALPTGKLGGDRWGGGNGADSGQEEKGVHRLVRKLGIGI